MKKQDFTVLKIDDLHPFPDNPFRLVEDGLLMELSESIKEFGVVTPIITRPMEDGNGYEVIAAACPCLTACRDRDNPCFCFALRP